MPTKEDLIQLRNGIYELPREYNPNMRVPAHIIANEKLLNDIAQDRSLEQLANVATLPGIVGAALAMPDMHEGYGFPIGGVAATDINNHGIISPGGIGYDINCGVRLLATSLTTQEIKPYLERLADEIYNRVPSGVGRGGTITMGHHELDLVLNKGARRMVELGYGNQDDLTFSEENGCMSSARADKVSDKAKERGRDQIGTLGSGNHFLEIQKVEKIFDPLAAQAFGLEENMVAIMIHCGSRGLGHQTCTDYVKIMAPKLSHWNITLPDPELACAPFLSEEGQDYFAAMSACANFAWANRHTIAHHVREAFTKIIGTSTTVSTVYDICHNIGKRETHLINKKPTEVLMHRKGATRAFPAGHPAVPEQYKHVGHPVLVPGTMGTSSYVVVGTEEGMKWTFSSSCHGAGRRMSRMKAKKTIRGSTLRQELEARGIVIRCKSDPELAEEAPQAYKDVDSVISALVDARITQPVARLVPLAVIKGD